MYQRYVKRNAFLLFVSRDFQYRFHSDSRRAEVSQQVIETSQQESTLITETAAVL